MFKGTRASSADVAKYRKTENTPTSAKASEKMKGTRQTSSGPRGGENVGVMIKMMPHGEMMKGTRRAKK